MVIHGDEHWLVMAKHAIDDGEITACFYWIIHNNGMTQYLFETGKFSKRTINLGERVWSSCSSWFVCGLASHGVFSRSNVGLQR